MVKVTGVDHLRRVQLDLDREGSRSDSSGHGNSCLRRDELVRSIRFYALKGATSASWGCDLR
jgi:hypothetical protein